MIALFIFLTFTLFALTLEKSFAQESSEIINQVKKGITISGDLNAYSEYFKTNNSFVRRPPTTGRIILRPTLDLFNLIQIPFEFLISTEGSSARQDINQYGINPRWSWGSLYLGDFSTEYSRYTLSGIRIRGAGFELFPGKFRFSVLAGLTKRAVAGGAADGSFKRFLYAAKVGFGSEGSSYIDFIFVRSKDEVTSIEQNLKSITILMPNGNDFLEVGSIVFITWNSFGVEGPVRIELSRDGGSTFELLSDNQANIGTFTWTVTGPPTNQGLIKISSVQDSSVFDLSDNYFSIGSGFRTNILPNNKNLANLNAITPQENLVIGSKGRISLFNNMFSFDFDGGGSVYTRDLRATAIDLDSIKAPSFLKNIYKPRVGTNLDFAFNTSLQFRIQSFQTRIGYKRIQPGYNSLGVPFMHNDVQEISIFNGLRFSRVSLTFSYTRMNDNLLNQKTYTTFRNNYNASINTNITNKWSMNLSGNFMEMKNNSSNDTTKVLFQSLVMNYSNFVSFDQKDFIQNIGFNYSYQISDNKSFLVTKNQTQMHSLNLNFAFRLLSNLNASLGAGLNNTIMFDTVKYTNHNYSLSFNHRAFGDKLNSSMMLFTAFNRGNNSFRVSLSSGYSLTKKDNLSFALAFMSFNNKSIGGSSFNEFVMSLGYNRSF
ncbi:MAG: hypothetical protein N3F03_01935 [Ignavibacteria bacterium]|nr:hypothetical protein [Ignavibacteria bacterium]